MLLMEMSTQLLLFAHPGLLMKLLAPIFILEVNIYFIMVVVGQVLLWGGEAFYLKHISPKNLEET